jgi:hypothetical protein
VSDISEFALRRLTAGHGYKQPVVAVHDAHVMNDEFVIKGDGDDRFHAALSVDLADADVSDPHEFHSFVILAEPSLPYSTSANLFPLFAIVIFEKILKQSRFEEKANLENMG